MIKTVMLFYDVQLFLEAYDNIGTATKRRLLSLLNDSQKQTLFQFEEKYLSKLTVTPIIRKVVMLLVQSSVVMQLSPLILSRLYVVVYDTNTPKVYTVIQEIFV